MLLLSHGQAFHELFVMQTGPRGQREWKFYETVQHEKQAAAAASSTVGEPHDPSEGTGHDTRNSKPVAHMCTVTRTRPWFRCVCLNQSAFCQVLSGRLMRNASLMHMAMWCCRHGRQEWEQQRASAQQAQQQQQQWRGQPAVFIRAGALLRAERCALVLHPQLL